MPFLDLYSRKAANDIAAERNNIARGKVTADIGAQLFQTIMYGINQKANADLAEAKANDLRTQEEREQFNTISAVLGVYPDMANPKLLDSYEQGLSSLTGAPVQLPTDQAGNKYIPKSVLRGLRTLVLDPKTGGLSKEFQDALAALDKPQSDLGKLVYDFKRSVQDGDPPEVLDQYIKGIRKSITRDRSAVEGALIDRLWETDGIDAAFAKLKELREAGASRVNVQISSPSERTAASKLQTLIDKTRRVRDMLVSLNKDGYYVTGLAAPEWNLLKQYGPEKIFGNDPRGVTFYKAKAELASAITTLRAGATQSPDEMKRIDEFSAVGRLSPSAAVATFDNLLDTWNTELRNVQESQSSVGVNPSTFNRAPKSTNPGRLGNMGESELLDSYLRAREAQDAKNK